MSGIIILLLALVAQGASAAVVNAIQATSGSIMGGTYFSVWGSGFNRGGLQGDTVVFVGSSVCKTIEYFSSDSRIVCFTPPGPPNTAQAVTVQTVSVNSGASFATNMGCSPCALTYSSSNTPTITASSLGGYSGSTLSFWGYVVGKDSSWFQVHVGTWDTGFRCDVDDALQVPPFKYTDSRGNGAARCTISASEAGRYNISFEVRDPALGLTDGYGQAARTRIAKQVAPGAMGGVYHVTIVPTVTSVSSTMSGLLGGSDLTISGAGFSSAPGGNAVFLLASDGTGGDVWVPCAVSSSTSTSLTCTPGAAAGSTILFGVAGNASAPRTFSGGAGLLHNVYLGAGNAVTTDFYARPPLSTPSISLINADGIRGYYNNEVTTLYSQLLVGYFTPPVTANYSFYLRGDDSIALFLSTDETPGNKTLIASVPGYTPSFWSYASQESTPRNLIAGQRYWMQVQHLQGTGGDFLDVGMRVFADGNAEATAYYGVNALQEEFASVPDVQNVQTVTDIVREQQVITIAGAAVGGQWGITVGGTLLTSTSGTSTTTLIFTIPAGAPPASVASTLKTALTSSPRLVSGCSDITVGPATAVNVTTGEGATANGYSWTVTVNCPAPPLATPSSYVGHPTILPVSISLQPKPGIDAVILTNNVLVPASEPLAGTFRLGLNVSGMMTWTQAFSVKQDTGTIAAALNGLTNAHGGIEVTSAYGGCRGTNVPDCAAWQVTFWGAGDVPLLFTDTSLLTGAGANVSVVSPQEGSSDPFFVPLPAAGYLQAPLPALPGIRVYSNGLLAACPSVPAAFGFTPQPGATPLSGAAASSCSFTYSDALTPTITGISPGYDTAPGVINVTAGAVLTITGTGFLDASDGGLLAGGNIVTIGGMNTSTCNVTAASSTSISCIVPDVPAGVRLLTLTVGGGRGIARLTSGVINSLLFEATVTSITPLTGSAAGGTRVTLYGTGLATPQGNSNTVFFGTTPCTIITSSPGQLVCSTRACSGGDAACASQSLIVGSSPFPTMSFSFISSMTPSLSAIAPSTLSAARSGRVNVTFTLPSVVSPSSALYTEGTLPSDTTIFFGTRACPIVTNGSVLLGGGSLLVTCRLTRGPLILDMPQAPVPPTLYLPPFGYASPSGVALDTSFRVNAAVLRQGSLLGGTNITITGVGLTSPPSSTVVNFYATGQLPTDANAALVALPCAVTSVAVDGTSLNCTTSPLASLPAPYDNAITGYFVVQQNQLIAPPSSGSLTDALPFAYSLAATPTLSALSVDTGSSSFVVEGTHLVAPLSISFTFASSLPAKTTAPSFYALTVDVSADGTFANGTLPSLCAGNFSLSGMTSAGVALINVTNANGAGASMDALSTNPAVFATAGVMGTLMYASPVVLSGLDTSASGAVGSVAGGHTLTLLGSGFMPSSSPSLGYTVISVCITTSCLTAPVVSATSSSVTFRTPALKSPFTGGVADIKVNVCSDAACVRAQRAPAAVLIGAYTYSASSTPLLSSVSPTSGPVGTLITITGTGLNTTQQPFDASVTIGGIKCDVVSWSNTSIACTVGMTTPGGNHRVMITFPMIGLARATPTGGVFFTAPLSVTGPSVASGGFGGGQQLTILGSGFAAPESGGSNAVVLCNQYCTVTSSSWGQINCTLPALTTPTSLSVFNTQPVATLKGNSFGAASSSYSATLSSTSAAAAFDGSVETAFSSQCRVGLDFGAPNVALVTRVRWYAAFQAKTAFAGGVWQGTTLAAAAATTSSAWTTIASVSVTTEGWNSIDLYNGLGQGITDWLSIPAWRSVQFVFATTGSSCKGLEMQIVGVLAAANAADGACPINVTVTGPSDPFIGSAAVSVATPPTGPSYAYTYSAASTPIVTRISPNNSTALGGTLTTISGSGFGSVVIGTSVSFNGVACAVATVTPSSITCVTGPRDAIRPLSVVVSIPGSGIALYNSSVTYMRYLDKWSSLTTWANNEPPVAGDTVIVPEGQSILVDISPPPLFLVYVEGALVFDRVDGLTFDAHYFIAVGGSIEAGQENEPYLNKLTITLHGDRYKSIELPNLGAKVLGIMNRMPLSNSATRPPPPANANSINGYPGANQATLDAGGLSTTISSSKPSSQGNSALGTLNGLQMGGDVAMTGMVVASLDLHGAPRLKVWTKVAATAVAGSTVISLVDAVDWAPGEQVVITSSSSNHREAETLTVVALLSPTLVEVTPPLKHDHESRIVSGGQFGHSDVDLRCEMGLLSRNIVVQGDDTSDSQLFGCQTMAMMGGFYRLENIEVRSCGQAFNLGRYSTHMHLLGNAGADSYVRHNSIHHSFQRMTTIHTTSYSNVIGNFGFDISGHALFLEDGVEMFNVIQDNLIASTFPCAACLKSDLKPASYWTASPTNFWRNNVAAGCTHDGYWLELPGNPLGPSYTSSICPVGNPLGEHVGNIAHSNGVHGIRLYPTVTPYNSPCDSSSGSSPQYFYNFTSWRNGAHGIFGKTNGALRHVHAKLVENGRDDYNQVRYVGAFRGSANLYSEVDPNIRDCLFIGTVDPIKRPIWNKFAIFAPQNEYFFISGATIVNYGSRAALTSCSECDNESLGLRSGAYTVRVQRLVWMNSTVRVGWSWPFKEIFYDVDGSLTGKGANSTAVAHFGFNSWPECPRDVTGVFSGGNVCNGDVVVRRMQLTSVAPNNLYQVNVNVSSAAGTDNVLWLPLEIYGWVWPSVMNKNASVVGKDYTVSFKSSSDWRTMALRYAEPSYVRDGEWTRLTFSWIDNRYRNQVWLLKDPLREVPALPLGMQPSSADVFGSGTTFYGTGNKTWTVGLSTGNVNGTNPFVNEPNAYALTVNNLQCSDGSVFNSGSGGCVVPPPPSISSNFTLWSDPASWASGVPPVAGEAVTINATQWVVLDVSTPPLGLVTILGRLTFLDAKPLMLTAASIIVWGQFYIGSANTPHVNRAQVVLTGVRTSPAVIVDNNIFAGNKVLLVLGDMKTFGTARNTTWTRLSTTANVGDSVLRLSPPGTQGSWYTGDSITVTPTEWDLPMQEETATIASVSADGLTVTLTRPLAYRHYAGPALSSPSSPRGSSARIAAAVGLLSRNVIIRGNVSTTPILITPPNSNALPYMGEDTYGGHILIAAVARASMPISSWRIGSSLLSHTQLLNMGKGAMEYAAFAVQYGSLTLDPDYTPLATQALANLVPHPINTLIGCTLSFSFNTGIQALGSKNLVVDSTIIHRARRNAIDIDITSLNFTLTNSLISNVLQSPDVNAPGTTQWVWPTAGVYIDARSVRAVTGNLVAGGNDAGFTYHPETTCGTSAVAAADAGFPPAYSASRTFFNNEVTATVEGVFLLPTVPSRVGGAAWCGLTTGGWTISKVAHIGILAVDALGEVSLVQSSIMESHIGVSFNYYLGQRTQARSDVQDTLLVGSGPATAPVEGSTCPASSVCRAATKTDPSALGASLAGGSCGSVLGASYFRAGIMGAQYMNRGKTCFVGGDLPVCQPPNLPERLCGMPWENRYGLPSTRATQLYLTRVTFAGYADNTTLPPACGATLSRAYVHNPAQVDMHVPVYASGIVWDGVPQDSRFAFATSWASEDASGGDGLRMVLLADADGSLTASGIAGSSILGPNPPAGEDFPQCLYINAWPGMSCPGLVLRQAIMENMDMDRGGRTLGSNIIARLPLAAVNESGSVNFDNRTIVSRGPVNDLCPMRLYFGQYPFLVRPNVPTHVMWVGTEPGQTRFHFFSPHPEETIVLKYFVQRPNTLDVYANGNFVPADTVSLPSFSGVHGANQFSPQARHITLVMRGKTDWAASPVDVLRVASVQVSITLSMSASQFYNGGQAAVVANLALLLGISPSQIKTVSVAAAATDERRLLASQQRGVGRNGGGGSSGGVFGALRLLQAVPNPLTSILIEIISAMKQAPVPDTPGLEPPTASSSTTTTVTNSSLYAALFNASGEATLAAVDFSYAADTLFAALNMSALSDLIVLLGTTGQLSSLGGFPVTALSVLPPIVPNNGTSPLAGGSFGASNSGGVVTVISSSPPLPTSTGGGGPLASVAAAISSLGAGAIAGIVIGAVFGLLAILTAILAIRRHIRYHYGSVKPWVSSRNLTGAAPRKTVLSSAPSFRNTALMSNTVAESPNAAAAATSSPVVVQMAGLSRPLPPLGGGSEETGGVFQGHNALLQEGDEGVANAGRGARGSPAAGRGGAAGLSRAAAGSTRVIFTPMLPGGVESHSMRHSALAAVAGVAAKEGGAAMTATVPPPSFAGGFDYVRGPAARPQWRKHG